MLSLIAAASTTLVLGGQLDHPRTLTVAELQALPAHTSAPFAITTLHGDTKGPQRTYTGVLLRDLLAGVKDVKAACVVAVGTDGYRAVFSWRELADTAVGDEAMVAYARDGKPLDAHEGLLELVSPTDRHTGPRLVHNLARLEVVVP